jgi:hypothetical protein
MTVEAPDRPADDTSTRVFRSLRQSSRLFVGPIAITAPLMLAPRVRAVGRPAAGRCEHLSRHRNLGHLKHDVADNLSADLDQLFPIAEVVGERMELKTDGAGGERGSNRRLVEIRADDLVDAPAVIRLRPEMACWLRRSNLS